MTDNLEQLAREAAIKIVAGLDAARAAYAVTGAPVHEARLIAAGVADAISQALAMQDGR